MRQFTNLCYPDTPFGSVGTPWRRTGAWMTGVSVLWGEAGGEPPVIMGAAMVFAKVHRTRPLPVSVDLAQFGYRILVPEKLGENDALRKVLDDTLVQARRKAQFIAWHNGADDLHVLRSLPRPDGTPRDPGIESVVEAWGKRDVRDPSAARCVDSSHDLGPAGPIADTALAHGLAPMAAFAGTTQQDHAQEVCEALTEGRYLAAELGVLAASVLSSAVTAMLLGGKAVQRLEWYEPPLDVTAYIRPVAWDVAPELFGVSAPAGH